MKQPTRVLLKVYVRPALKQRIDDLAARANLSSSRVVERLIETGRAPDPSGARAIADLLAVNASQARLGNLMLKALNETANGDLASELQTLLREIRSTQSLIKTRVKGIRP